ncbi:MAG: hypothetical protein HN790_17900 [Methylococcales bacterium]|nr:hypothetical protein [Methylococcales bacterium]
MRYTSHLTAILLLFSTWSDAANPDITKLHNQLSELSIAIEELPIGDTANAKRHLQQLQGIADALKTITHKGDDWKEAATEYNRLHALAAQKNTTPPKNDDEPPIESVVLSAIQQVSAINQAYQDMKPGDTKAAKQLNEELSRTLQLIQSATDKNHPAWQKLMARQKRLAQNILSKSQQSHQIQSAKGLDTSKLPPYVQAKLNRFQKDADHTLTLIANASNSDLADPSIKNNLNNRIERHRNVVTTLQPQSHPAIQALSKQLEQTSKLLTSKLQESANSSAAFGDVQSRCDSIENNLQHLKIPAPLQPPLLVEMIVKYAAQMSSAQQQQVERDLSYLKKIDGKTQVIRQETLIKLIFWAEQKTNALADNLENSIQNIDNWVEQYTRQLGYLNATDINNQGHKANRLLGRDQLLTTLNTLNDGLNAVSIAHKFDAIMARPSAPNRQQQKERINHTLIEMQKKFTLALKGNTMPPPVSEDKKLLDIAQTTLARPSYRINHIERMIISKSLTPQLQQKNDWQNGSLATKTYQWDEFKATTAEKVGDEYFLFDNHFKFYHSGDNTTILDRWILSGRVEGMQILLNNIHSSKVPNHAN